MVAGLLRRLWSAPVQGFAFRPLQAMCDRWAEEFTARMATTPGLIDPGLAREGIALFRALPAGADRRVLLATDLHAGNVLAAEREPWLLIDPKPYVGDATYDPLQHLLNCEERLHADPAGLAGRLAELCGLDPVRMRRWLFARCVPAAGRRRPPHPHPLSATSRGGPEAGWSGRAWAQPGAQRGRVDVQVA